MTLLKEMSKSNKLKQKSSALPTLPLPLPYMKVLPVGNEEKGFHVLAPVIDDGLDTIL